MRYLEDFAIGHMRALGDRVWERMKQRRSVRFCHLDVGGAHTSPTVRDPTCNLWHLVC